MGRTVFGVDLDESVAGGLVASLLTDEEIEKLADGGRPADDDSGDEDAPSDGPGDADDASDGDADDASDGDADDTGGVDIGEFAATGAAAGDVDIGRVGDTAWAGADTDRAGADTDRAGADTDRAGAGGLRDRIPSVGGDGEDAGGGRLASLRPLLLKVAVVLLLLAVVAILVYRYMDAIRAALPDRLTGGSGEPDAGEASFGDDVSPARRRAKVGRDRSASTDRADETASASTDRGDTSGASEKRDTSEDETDGGLRAPGEDVDVGALVGLGALALVAALVRKFGEDRPRDPLVDGPEE
ncbi:hypothetical protein BRC92_08810 [Halobacteriales archaeon QS_4_69_31]|nr:MAG: hypothetical protein BRC92_08810 [Halobacteriales archaeon QS_4_69_31]